MNLIPKPNGEMLKSEGFFNLKPTLSINLGGFKEESLLVYKERTNINFEVKNNDLVTDILFVKNNDFKNEEHKIEIIPEKITITSSTDAGIILALTTLYLVQNENNIPCFSITDEPRYSHRALMIDSARNFYEAEEIKKIIEEMALVKLNVFHWHLSDDQGWRVESDIYPELCAGQKHYTKNEIRDVVQFAKSRNIEVIPEIDMPGHTTAIISIFPELSCKGEKVEIGTTGGIYKVILCAGKEKTYEFAYNLLGEVADLFESEYFHIGGDEAPKSEWQECPDCKNKLAELGTESFEDLQGHFTIKMEEFLKTKGKKIIAWNDLLTSKILPENLTVQQWLQFTETTPVRPFIENGGDVIFSDMFHIYFDYPHSITSLKKVYSYVPSLEKVNFEDNKNALGIEACLWSERIRDNDRLEELIFPRTFATAEIAWTINKDYEDFEKRLIEKVKTLDEKNINYTKQENWNPEGEKRMAEIVAFFQNFIAHLGGKDDKKTAINFDENMMKTFFGSFDLPSDFLNYFK